MTDDFTPWFNCHTQRPHRTGEYQARNSDGDIRTLYFGGVWWYFEGHKLVRPDWYEWRGVSESRFLQLCDEIIRAE